MAQTIQIVPKFVFPSVDIYVNDYTEVAQDVETEAAANTLTQAYAVTSSQGIDNRFVKKSSLADAVRTFGPSNFKKYGQPLMQAYSVLESGGSEVWIMRVMPKNAEYANAVVSAYVKKDTVHDYVDASKRKFRLKFTKKHVSGAISDEELKTKAVVLDGRSDIATGKYKDGEGYVQNPILICRPSGRGVYGNDYSVVISKNASYEKEYGIKLYNFDILSAKNGLSKVANFIGCLTTSSKYETTTLINDVLEDADVGVAPADIYVFEDTIVDIYDEYIEFCKQQHEDLQVEFNSKLIEYGVTLDMVKGTEAIPSDDETLPEKVDELRYIYAMIDESDEEALPDVDEFDLFFGTRVNSTSSLPFLEYTQKLTEDVDTDADDFDPNDYTATPNVVEVGIGRGITLDLGSDGYFAEPREEEIQIGGAKRKWTLEEEIEECYNSAFDGTFDSRILTAKRIPVSAFFDANYPMSTKKTLAKLTLLRGKARLYLDTGVSDTSYSNSRINALVKDYSQFDSYLISKNLQHYTVRESGTQKRVVVSITYFLASQYAAHMLKGNHIPFVKANAQLAGHVKDSLAPTIEDYESDLKTILYNNRFNYFETLDENVFQRATQLTAQSIETDLSEENNVTVLCEMQNIIEKDIQENLYDFTDSAIRAAFKSYEEAVFAPWINNKILSFSIDFKASPWEEARSIIHAYLSVVFRGLQKRAIVEIDINKRNYASAVDEEA